MKKAMIGFLAALLLVCAVAFAMADTAIDEAHFPDAIFCQYVSDSFDTDGDGILGEEEAQGVTSMSVDNMGISDLMGIEYFPALVSLTCADNQLTALDVSSNTALTTLTCSDNQLASLDVSSLTDLTFLSCSRNQLASLDVSHNTGLTMLYVSSNSLAELDVSHNTELITLNCDNNLLTELVLSSNTKITNLACGSNQLACLDLSMLELDKGSNGSSGNSGSVCSGNIRPVTAEGGVFDLSTLPGFDVSKASNWTGGTVDGTILTVERSTVVSYQYDCGLDDLATFTLRVIVPGTVIDVTIDEAHFPDEIFRQYVSDSFDTDGDGVLSETEIICVTDISVESMEISDLTGIEYFIELSSLDCYNNQLTALDISSNSALTTLSCAYNSLTALDVSSNTALTSLNLNHNQLASLDVSSNTSLGTLECGYNQLTALDVSHNTAMWSLSCGYNQLTALDVSSNTALTTLYCDGNKLASLDVSNNMALMTLGCSSNSLASLDVSSNTSLLELYCYVCQLTELDVSHNKSLTRLQCNNNALTALDVSSNTMLSVLHCNMNSLSALDVSSNTALTELRCNNNLLTALDLSHNTQLATLHCESNLLTELDLSSNIKITTLYCGSNRLVCLDLSMLDLSGGDGGSGGSSGDPSSGDSGSSFYGNIRPVEAEGGVFDLSTLPGFDVSKASNWAGGTVDGTILTVQQSGDVTYTYDCGVDDTVTFTLRVTVTDGPGIVASGECGASLTWTLSDDGVLTISGTGDMDNYYFGEGFAPWVGMNVRSVIVEEGVTSIGYRAFEICSSIVSVEFPDTLTYIYDVAFYGCTSLAEITIPASVTDIAQNAFYNCDSLTEVSLPAAVVNIQRGAFSSCSSLLSITVDGENTAYSSIDGVLYNKDATVIVTCPAGRQGAFTVPDSVTSINEGAFAECAGLTEIVIPESVSYIGSSAFFSCSGLTDLMIPDGVQSIYPWVFQYCTNLRQVAIPASVTGISLSAFEGCSNLSDVYYGGSEAQWSIVSVAEGNDVLQDVEVHYNYHGYEPFVPEIVDSGECGTGVTWTLDNTGVLTISGSGEMEFSGSTPPWGTSVTAVQIESGVTGICNYAFSGCTHLTAVSIPDSVTDIGYSAFYGCTSLKNITLPESVTSIGSSAFYGCTSLKNITLPESVTSIGSSAFSGCSTLRSITIPDSVTTIGSNAFFGCNSLMEITIPAGVTSIGQGAFSFCLNLSGITVAEENPSYTSVDGVLYNKLQTELLACPGGKTGVFTIPENVTGIGSCAFGGCSGLQGIIIPESVTAIGSSAFESCSGLQGVIIPESVTAIGSYAFYCCSALQSIVIPDGVTRINDETFFGCTGLKEVTIPNSVTSIGSYAFSNCTGLKEVTIPNSVTSIDSYAFFYCTGLEEVTIPNSVTSIGSHAFSNCTGLKEVTIPASVASIGYYSFMGCNSLASVTIENPDVEFITSDGGSGGSGGSSGNPIFGNAEAVTLYAAAGSTTEEYAEDYGLRFVPTSGMPEETEGLLFTLNGDGTFSVTGYTGTDTEVVILSEHEELPVTAIAGWAFSNNTAITAVSLPDSITAVDAEAFAGCTGLAGISLPSGVSVIGERAFAGCTGLASAIIPASVTVIGSDAFDGCSSLQDIYYAGTEEQWNAAAGIGQTWNGAVVHYNSEGPDPEIIASGECGDSLSWTLDETGLLTISGIGEMSSHPWTDEHTNDIKKVVIEEGVTSICDEAFTSCKNMKAIWIPNSMRSVGGAFSGCSRLSDVWYNGISMDFGWGLMGMPMGGSDLSPWTAFVEAHVHYAESQAAGDEYVASVLYVLDTLTGEEILPSNEGIYEGPNETIIRVAVTAPDIPGYTKSFRFNPYGAIVWFGPYTPDEEGKYEYQTSLSYMNFRMKVVYVPEAGGATLISRETSINLQGISEGASGITVEAPSDYCLVGAGYGYTVRLQVPDGIDIDKVTYWYLSLYNGNNWKYSTGSYYGVTVQEGLSIPESVLEEGDYSVSLGMDIAGYNSLSASLQFRVVDVSGLEILQLPANLARIEDEAFAGGAFQTVVIPDGCGYIGHRAFAGCTGLLYVSCPSGIVMEEDAFEGCGEQLVIVNR